MDTQSMCLPTPVIVDRGARGVLILWAKSSRRNGSILLPVDKLSFGPRADTLCQRNRDLSLKSWKLSQLVVWFDCAERSFGQIPPIFVKIWDAFWQGCKTWMARLDKMFRCVDQWCVDATHVQWCIDQPWSALLPDHWGGLFSVSFLWWVLIEACWSEQHGISMLFNPIPTLFGSPSYSPVGR